MQIQETITFLRWLCEHEYRIQYSDAAVEVWAYSLRTVEPAVAKQAVLEHYKANETVVATPGGIAKRAANIKASRAAGQRASEIEPPRPVKTEADYRRKIRETPEFMALFEQGRREGNAMREAATRAREGNPEENHDGWMAA